MAKLLGNFLLEKITSPWKSRIIKFVIHKVLGEWIKDLDVDLQILNGRLKLNDVELREEKINSILSSKQIPLLFESGSINKLEFYVPFDIMNKNTSLTISGINLFFKLKKDFLSKKKDPKKTLSSMRSSISEIVKPSSDSDVFSSSPFLSEVTNEELTSLSSSSNDIDHNNPYVARILERLLSNFKFDLNDVKIVIDLGYDSVVLEIKIPSFSYFDDTPRQKSNEKEFCASFFKYCLKSDDTAEIKLRKNNKIIMVGKGKISEVNAILKPGKEKEEVNIDMNVNFINFIAVHENFSIFLNTIMHFQQLFVNSNNSNDNETLEEVSGNIEPLPEISENEIDDEEFSDIEDEFIEDEFKDVMFHSMVNEDSSKKKKLQNLTVGITENLTVGNEKIEKKGNEKINQVSNRVPIIMSAVVKIGEISIDLLYKNEKTFLKNIPKNLNLEIKDDHLRFSISKIEFSIVDSNDKTEISSSINSIQLFEQYFSANNNKIEKKILINFQEPCFKSKLQFIKNDKDAYFELLFNPLYISLDLASFSKLFSLFESMFQSSPIKKNENEIKNSDVGEEEEEEVVMESNISKTSMSYNVDLKEINMKIVVPEMEEVFRVRLRNILISNKGKKEQNEFLNTKLKELVCINEVGVFLIDKNGVEHSIVAINPVKIDILLKQNEQTFEKLTVIEKDKKKDDFDNEYDDEEEEEEEEEEEGEEPIGDDEDDENFAMKGEYDRTVDNIRIFNSSELGIYIKIDNIFCTITRPQIITIHSILVKGLLQKINEMFPGPNNNSEKKIKTKKFQSVGEFFYGPVDITKTLNLIPSLALHVEIKEICAKYNFSNRIYEGKVLNFETYMMQYATPIPIMKLSINIPNFFFTQNGNYIIRGVKKLVKGFRTNTDSVIVDLLVKSDKYNNIAYSFSKIQVNGLYYTHVDNLLWIDDLTKGLPSLPEVTTDDSIVATYVLIQDLVVDYKNVNRRERLLGYLDRIKFSTKMKQVSDFIKLKIELKELFFLLHNNMTKDLVDDYVSNDENNAFGFINSMVKNGFVRIGCVDDFAINVSTLKDDPVDKNEEIPKVHVVCERCKVNVSFCCDSIHVLMDLVRNFIPPELPEPDKKVKRVVKTNKNDEKTDRIVNDDPEVDNILKGIVKNNENMSLNNKENEVLSASSSNMNMLTSSIRSSGVFNDSTMLNTSFQNISEMEMKKSLDLTENVSLINPKNTKNNDDFSVVSQDMPRRFDDVTVTTYPAYHFMEIKDDYMSSTLLHGTRAMQLSKEYPKQVQFELLFHKKIIFKIELYEGRDFYEKIGKIFLEKKHEKKKTKNVKRKKVWRRRDLNTRVSIDLCNIFLRFNLFSNAESHLFRAKFAIENIIVHDKLKDSDRNLLLSFLPSSRRPRIDGSNMIELLIDSERVVGNEKEIQKDVEERQCFNISVGVLPMRVNLHQKALYFLGKFLFNVVSEDFGAPSPHTPPQSPQNIFNSVEKQKSDEKNKVVEEKSSVLSEKTEKMQEKPENLKENDKFMVKSFSISEIKLKIDYAGSKEFGYSFLSDDGVNFLKDLHPFLQSVANLGLNFSFLNDAKISMPPMRLKNIVGKEENGKYISGITILTGDITDHYLGVLKSTRIFGIVMGLLPIKGLYNVGEGFADIFVIPIKEIYKGTNDGYFLRGIRRGLASFGSKVAKESVETTASISGGFSYYMKVLSKFFKSKSTRRSSRDDDDDESEMPESFKDAAHKAYKSVKRGLTDSAFAFVAIPKAYSKKGAKGIVFSTFKAIPLSILGPISGVSGALSNLLHGVNNFYFPNLKEEHNAKYK